MNVFDLHALKPLALILYTGPDQMLPILSFLGASLGILLMWWRRILMAIRRLFKADVQKTETSTKNPE